MEQVQSQKEQKGKDSGLDPPQHLSVSGACAVRSLPSGLQRLVKGVDFAFPSSFAAQGPSAAGGRVRVRHQYLPCLCSAADSG